jgi:hypothetical protein
MMKKSSKLILLFLALFLAGLFYTDNILNDEYRKINLADPLKNYETLKTEVFSRLSIKGGNGYSIKIVPGKEPRIQVMKSRKEFLKYSVAGGLLTIDFKVPVINIMKANLENVPAGIIITIPELSAVSAAETYIIFDSVATPRMNVSLQGSSLTTFRKIVIPNLSITAAGNSYTELKDGSSADSLTVSLLESAVFRLNDTRFTALLPVLKDKAEIIFSSTSVKQYKSAN